MKPMNKALAAAQFKTRHYISANDQGLGTIWDEDGDS